MTSPHTMGANVSSRSRTRYIVVVLLLCGVITNGLAMLPDLRPGALLLRLASLPLAVAALLLVLLRPAEGNAEAGRRERRRWAPWATAVAAFVVGALAWGTLTTVSSNAGAPEFSLDLIEPAQGPQTVTVSTETIDLTDEARSSEVLEEATTKAEEFVEITGSRAEELVDAARAAGYAPRSGLAFEWAQAVVQSFNGWDLVTVPLAGTNVPELSKVTYFRQGESAEVVEWAAAATDPTTIQVQGWQNGGKIRESIFVIEGYEQNGAEIATAGLNYDKLERCLTRNGLPQWILNTIFAVCSLVCIFTLGAGCIACIAAWAGANTAVIYDCVKRAWT